MTTTCEADGLRSPIMPHRLWNKGQVKDIEERDGEAFPHGRWIRRLDLRGLSTLKLLARRFGVFEALGHLGRDDMCELMRASNAFQGILPQGADLKADRGGWGHVLGDRA